MNKLHHRFELSATSIMEYAKSIGADLQMVDGTLIAPSTMPIIFWTAFDVPWLNTDLPILHGKQQFYYEAPLEAGMMLDCELSLIQMERKSGRRGELTLYTHMLTCSYNGRLLMSSETILISVKDRV
ncbi:hypothetical protein J2Z69_000924 [Paenibacillus shirakamiensis]|uniref:N-terminal of MaoC-like dehydratase domain-containing protein n=1 Tax=Paenibacillus shirakamiensis TaxID=1265935 RepID=A0ABS4JDZ7_9BACL|nr:MaoC family dehydratase N-terminal domain-containing protein [Paenibacillus shirakamiensis]MBP1999905.1 hypothetical protein [Paenibacillus shirakamiensis]